MGLASLWTTFALSSTKQKQKPLKDSLIRQRPMDIINALARSEAATVSVVQITLVFFFLSPFHRHRRLRRYDFKYTLNSLMGIFFACYNVLTLDTTLVPRFNHVDVVSRINTYLAKYLGKVVDVTNSQLAVTSQLSIRVNPSTFSHSKSPRTLLFMKKKYLVRIHFHRPILLFYYNTNTSHRTASRT